MAIAMITTTTADASGTEVIAVEPRVVSGNIHTARNVNARIQRPLRHQNPKRLLRKPSALVSAHNPNSERMVVVTTITIIVAVVGMVGIAVAHLATSYNGFTARSASAETRTMTTVAALARVVRLHGLATAIVMTVTIIAAANMMGAIAAVKVTANTSILTARCASAWTNHTNLKRTATANVVHLITPVTAVVMTITTTVLAGGILVIAAENLETSGNFHIVRSVNAKTPK